MFKSFIDSSLNTNDTNISIGIESVQLCHTREMHNKMPFKPITLTQTALNKCNA